MTDITIRKLNHAFIKIESCTDIALELSDAFKFLVDGYKFMPAYRNGTFDGYIRLFNLGNRQMASGLYRNVLAFAEERGYVCETVDDSEQTGYEPPSYQTPGITTESMLAYMQSLDLSTKGSPIDIRGYQVEGVVTMIRERQCIIKSSVGSGKSMILYCACRYITEVLGLRVLIIVPTVGLTTQMRGDFADYASESDWDVESNIHTISGGADHSIRKPIVISTFQSLSKSTPAWLNDFGAIISDEGHSITAKSFQTIYGKAIKTPFRIACTGTLSAMKCNVLTMIGLTGPVCSIAETKDLIAAGQLVPMKIKAISLDYSPDVCKAMKNSLYDEEIHWLTECPKRNDFVKKLALNCVGTTLVFFRFVEQGKALYEAIKDVVGDTRHVYFIDGSVGGLDRENIRVVSNMMDSIIVCSYGTFRAGVNIPAIENIIIGHPIKGGITFLQVLGRGLRLKEGKSHCNLYDISDNLSHGRYVNHTFRHFGDRMLALTKEGYEFSLVNVPF